MAVISTEEEFLPSISPLTVSVEPPELDLVTVAIVQSPWTVGLHHIMQTDPISILHIMRLQSVARSCHR
jgi:hypothetical protein